MASWRVGSCFFFFFVYLGKQIATLGEEAGIAAGAGGMVRGKTTRFTGYLWPVVRRGGESGWAGRRRIPSLPFPGRERIGGAQLRR
jgi:hypothetical protein